MIVWNDSTSTANDLEGVGFTIGKEEPLGHWYKLSTDTGVDAGTVTNTTLRWNGFMGRGHHLLKFRNRHRYFCLECYGYRNFRGVGQCFDYG